MNSALALLDPSGSLLQATYIPSTKVGFAVGLQAISDQPDHTGSS
jgi:hypothetical protein